jgi:hypothetical protein
MRILMDYLDWAGEPIILALALGLLAAASLSIL